MATSLLIHIKNTGAPAYRVFYRKAGSNDPYAGGDLVTAAAVPAQFTDYSVIGVDAFRYEWYIVTVCADGTESVNSQLFYSRACPVPTGLNVYTSGNNFIVQYSLPVTVGRFRLRIEYPNGGQLNNNYIADQTGQVIIPKPSGVYGDFLFSIASICNLDTDFISEFLSDVLVEVLNPSVCIAPTILNYSTVSTASNEETIRFFLGGYTSTVRIYINNTTTNTNNTLTQTVIAGTIDVPLSRSSVIYAYQITIFNICDVGQDNLGDMESISIPANV